PRLWFSTVVYRGRMWVIGGWSEEHGNFGDVWYSDDGKNWTELRSGPIWSPRHEHSALVFKDKIWVAGGCADPSMTLDSEVWSLSIPEDWFAKR
ncbi:MAG TPA: kelch repeat-containing protein, partial [Candidatus Aminicenantes bacterium]|nr:kelch repeat-containing protein [Candidatus Aminicenantes bacterium]